MRDSETRSSAIRGIVAAPKIAYRIRDAAEQIGISEREMWRLVKSGAIDSFKFGDFKNSPRRISHEALLDYVEARIKASTVAKAA